MVDGDLGRLIGGDVDGVIVGEVLGRLKWRRDAIAFAGLRGAVAVARAGGSGTAVAAAVLLAWLCDNDQGEANETAEQLAEWLGVKRKTLYPAISIIREMGVFEFTDSPKKPTAFRVRVIPADKFANGLNLTRVLRAIRDAATGDDVRYTGHEGGTCPLHRT